MNNNREKTEIELLIEKRIKELETELSYIEKEEFDPKEANGYMKYNK